MTTICLLPGDGVGTEVIPAAAEILDVLDLGITTETHKAGWECFQETGSALPKSTLSAIKRCTVTLFGATSSPSGGAPGYRSPILDLRQELNLYANLRPAYSLPVRASRANIDILIVRENTEGLYIRRERWQDADTAIAERSITRIACERIARVAAEHALKRRGMLTIAHKANVLTVTDNLFRKVVRETAEDHAPGVQIEERFVDALAHDLVRMPERFDVIVAPNLYGDILSDLASGLVGGMGVAPSANIGGNHSMYEPVHGSAPDIAGKGIANPIAALLSLGMALSDLGHSVANEQLSDALIATLASGICTPDLGGTATTEDVLTALKERLS
ncbi:MAG: isocitrate/isopropylmalate dehydrogenase family protein [Anaerolineales bacterium]|jgi:homoisocitrate dehydrogenase|nr:isocitrate/isopropylmalate dehydrogenase family protein [Anaerolineales bacterium]